MMLNVSLYVQEKNMIQTQGRWAFDIEASSLLDHTSVDYTQSPYKIKDNFLIHCICFQDIDTNQTVDFVRTDYPTHEEFRLYVLDFIEEYVQVFIAQNGLDYDWLVLKAYFGIDYFVAGDPSEQDTFNGKPIVFRDTLVMSKLLNSERYGGHSLESWGEEFGFPKINWRQKAIELGLIEKSSPKGAEFRAYHPEMLVYCKTDVAITARLFLHLEKEMEGWNWLSSLLLEQFIRDNITKQSHRGFLFDSEAAHGYLDDLDNKMQTIEEKVLPLLPDKPLTKGDLDSWTPPTRQLIYEQAPQVPKVQIKKDGSPSQAMLRYAERVGGTIENYDLYDAYSALQGDTDTALWLRVGDSLYPFSSMVPLEQDTVPFYCTPTLSTNIENWVQKHNGFLYFVDDKWIANIEGEDYILPIECKPLKTHKRPSLKDSIHLKQWLVTKGWIPTEWKEKDLTINTKKQKLTPEQFASTIQRYIEQTLESPFRKFRFEHLQVKTNQQFINKLQNHDLSRPLKVITNPNLTIGQSKEIDPSLLRLSAEFPYAADVSHYLTYNHRRNSIVGGGYQFDEDNDEEPETGFLSHGRLEQDGRLPTPADTQGAASGRFRHKFIVNLARNTSLYGAELRSLFGVDPERYFLLGFDFSGLEARIEGHYTYRYDDANKSYVNSLLGERPNDVHTLTAKKIAEIIGRDFARQDAKSVKYACVPMHTQALTRNGWKQYHELSIGDIVLGYDAESKTKKWTKITNLIHQDDEVIEFGHRHLNLQATKDHRWFVKQRKMNRRDINSIRRSVEEVRTTEQLNSESNIIANAPLDSCEDLTSSVNNFLAESKRNFNWVQRVLDMSQSERKAFLEGFMIADGYFADERWQWSQNIGELSEAALLASYLVHDCTIQVRSVNNAKSPMINCILGKKSHYSLQTIERKSLGIQPVWCMTTELGSWVMRQGNTITITGNCSYGAMPKKVGKTIGASEEVGKLVHEAFWNAALPLAELKKNLERYWETIGQKKFILGLDGRKIPTRSKSALINYLFQSAGVICTKRAAWFHDRMLRARGLICDFWVDDWRTKSYAQQLIHYHFDFMVAS